MTVLSTHAIGALNTLQLGRVVESADPDGRGRVKVALHALDVEVWASVVVPSAGGGYGVSFVPKIDEIVVLAFVSPEIPLVLGSIWHGRGSAPEDADPVEDHYVVRTPAGTVMEFDDNDGPRFEVRTPQGNKLIISDGSGGEVIVERGGQRITMSTSEISVTASGTVKVDAPSIKLSAASVNVDAGISKFSGVVQCDTLISNAVVSSSYTPGAGNIW